MVAVYGFLDKTGQRKTAASQVTTSFSTAIGQASETYLIRALKRACRGRCFLPVERVGLDHLSRAAAHSVHAAGIRSRTRAARLAVRGRDSGRGRHCL